MSEAIQFKGQIREMHGICEAFPEIESDRLYFRPMEFGGDWGKLGYGLVPSWACEGDWIIRTDNGIEVVSDAVFRAITNATQSASSAPSTEDSAGRSGE